MNNPVLYNIIIDVLYFVEFSDSSIINDDAAINLMEQIVFELQKLSRDEKQQLAKHVEARVACANSEIQREYWANVLDSIGVEMDA